MVKDYIVHLKSFRIKADDIKDARFWANEAIKHAPTYNVFIEDIEEA